jgi:hypothetical protein
MTRKTLAGDRRRRKLITLLWALGLAAIVIALIYLERTAILYILCTLGVSVLLMIVAFANLDQHDTGSQQVAQSTDTVGVGNKAR